MLASVDALMSVYRQFAVLLAGAVLGACVVMLWERSGSGCNDVALLGLRGRFSLFNKSRAAEDSLLNDTTVPVSVLPPTVIIAKHKSWLDSLLQVTE